MRVTEAEDHAVRELAKSRGKTVSELLRETALVTLGIRKAS
jgi:hypothetical protein